MVEVSGSKVTASLGLHMLSLTCCNVKKGTSCCPLHVISICFNHQSQSHAFSSLVTLQNFNSDYYNNDIHIKHTNQDINDWIKFFKSKRTLSLLLKHFYAATHLPVNYITPHYSLMMSKHSRKRKKNNYLFFKWHQWFNSIYIIKNINEKN